VQSRMPRPQPSLFIFLTSSGCGESSGASSLAPCGTQVLPSSGSATPSCAFRGASMAVSALAASPKS